MDLPQTQPGHGYHNHYDHHEYDLSKEENFHEGMYFIDSCLISLTLEELAEHIQDSHPYDSYTTHPEPQRSHIDHSKPQKEAHEQKKSSGQSTSNKKESGQTQAAQKHNYGSSFEPVGAFEDHSNHYDTKRQQNRAKDQQNRDSDKNVAQSLNKSEFQEAKNKEQQPRTIKSAHRGASEKSKQRSSKIVPNIPNADNQKRSSSYKERKQKASPLRSSKYSTKNEFGGPQYFSNKTMNNTGNISKKLKGLNTKSVRPTHVQPHSTTYKEPIHQHANLLKAHNLSLNNFRTEMKLPHAQKFLAETHFAKSPFLAKTLKGMMQPGVKPNDSVNTSHGSNYGRIGNAFQVSGSRKQREPSAHSNKSKRETSGSHKKSKGQQKLFTTK